MTARKDVKTCLSCEILSYIQPNKGACHSSMHTNRKQNSSAEISIRIITTPASVSEPQLPQVSEKKAGRHCTHSELSYRRSPELQLPKHFLMGSEHACSLLWKERLALSSMIICYLTILAKIVWNKVLCSPDIQKHKRPVENCLSAEGAQDIGDWLSKTGLSNS